MSQSQNSLLRVDPAVVGHIPELDAEPTEAQVQAFRRAGVGVLRGLVKPDEVKAIREAYMAAAEAGPIEGTSETGVQASPDGDGETDPLKRYPRMIQPHRLPGTRIGELALKYMLDQRFEKAVGAVMQDQPIAAQSMFYFKPPGGRGQALHQDNNFLSVHPGTCLAAWISLDHSDPDTGALDVVPGTGPLDMLCDAETEERLDIFFNGGSIKLPEGVESIPAVMAPGDVLLFNGQLVHGSYPNTTTDRWRRTLIFHYVPESCEQVAGFYHPLLGFDGSVVEKGISPEGGPCGEFRDKPAEQAVV